MPVSGVNMPVDYSGLLVEDAFLEMQNVFLLSVKMAKQTSYEEKVMQVL